MDGITNQIISMSTELQTVQLAENVQFYVLKEALDIQESSVASLLQPVAGPQPLSTSGNLGTQLNVYA